ncbi:hypothetical protein BS78_02G010700 [Paspalum vaginatum]|nr:hypothetical protein BS78_02G010700 [Paspalum vaginatum]
MGRQITDQAMLLQLDKLRGALHQGHYKLDTFSCMSDRKMEIQLVISFLLCTKPHRVEKPEVLLIVGPGRVGKSTLVAHVCNDERIRDHFSEVGFLTDHDFRA